MSLQNNLEKIAKTSTSISALKFQQQAPFRLNKSSAKRESVISYCKPKQKMMSVSSLDTLVHLFQWWESTINEFALQDIDQQNHAELRNPILQRQLQRKLEDPRALRICLILFQAEQHQPPYSLRRLADAMGGDKQDMDKNKLMQSQLKTLLKSLVAYGLLNYSAQTKPSQHYQISATEKLRQFFTLVIDPKLEQAQPKENYLYENL